MNFNKNENQQMIAQMVRHFPIDVMKQMGELGLLGVFVPEEYGGSGFGYFEYATALMELGRVCGGVGLSVAAHNSLCTGHIYYNGSEEQKRKYLPKLSSGEWIGAWGLTEANTGSDAMRMKTTAVLDGDEWVINGSKNWITHGLSGDVSVVLVRTGHLLWKKEPLGFLQLKLKISLGLGLVKRLNLFLITLEFQKKI